MGSITSKQIYEKTKETPSSFQVAYPMKVFPPQRLAINISYPGNLHSIIFDSLFLWSTEGPILAVGGIVGDPNDNDNKTDAKI